MELSAEVTKRICGSIQQQAAEFEVQSQWMKLNDFRKNEELCDIRILSQAKKHPAHKCVLSTASPYFKALFTSPCSNCEDAVDLTDFSAETVDFLLDLIYGVSDKESTDLCELLLVAEFIQFKSLVDNILSDARFHMNVDDCYQWYMIGKTSGLMKLTVLAKSYMMSHYEDVKKVEKYKDSFKLIEEIVSVKEPEFLEEVIIAAGNTYDVVKLNDPPYQHMAHHQRVSVDQMMKINLATKKVESIADGLNKFYIGDYRVDHGYKENFKTDPMDSLKICSFFEFQHDIVSVSVSCLDGLRAGQIHLRKFNPFIDDVGGADPPFKVIYMEKLFDGDWLPRVSTLTLHLLRSSILMESCFYNGTDSLYLIFRHIAKAVIFKLDLKSGLLSKNWVTVQRNTDEVFLPTRTITALVQMKSYGTVLVDKYGALYNIESFEFQEESQNHSPQPLVFRMERSCKKMRREVSLLEDIESFTAFCCDEDLFLVSSRGNDVEQSLYVHRFDVKSKSWVKCSALDMDYAPKVNGSFCYHGDAYVVVQDLKGKSTLRDLDEMS